MYSPLQRKDKHNDFPVIHKRYFRLLQQLEDDNDQDQGRFVLVIFDFEIMASMSQVTTSLRPYTDYEEENTIPEIPWLDVELVRCNCSSFPEVGNIGVKSSSNGNTSQAANDSSESESDNDVSHEDVSSTTSDDSDNPDETPALFTEYFKLKGSTYHAHFQDALRRCKRLSMDKRDISIKLLIEPANARDENAIVVQVQVDSTWQPVGYIPAVKIKKAMDALEKNEVKNITFKCIEWKYIYGLGKFKYVASVTITKLNKWLPTDKNYQYNDFL